MEGLEHPWDVVAIVCFCVFGVLIILGVSFRVKLYLHYQRVFKSQKRSTAGLTPSLQRAIAQLDSVTDNRGRMSDRRSCEGTDCPICLCSLYFTPQRAAEEEVDLEAGVSRTTTTCTGTTDSTNAQETTKKAELELPPINDEVLKMKRCQHMFHARCLATWYLRRRYDCPVCRTVYYQAIEPGTSRDDIHEPPPTMPVLPFW